MILTPVGIGLELSSSFSVFQPEVWHTITKHGSDMYHPLFGTWVIYEVALNIFTMIFSICLLVLMLRKSRRFPALMIFYFISAVILHSIDSFIGNLIYSDLPNLAQGEIPYIEGVLRAVVQAAVWVPYFIRSKRVKVTFLSKDSKIIFDEKPTDQNIPY
ncbi:DUF2569 domain-containing protein [Neobacillus niacini]|uniref:DUF2569 domain-containing protein n=1 Tax=Neobacillus niacini TaxID=86668 RepID=UPI0005ED9148|nr:DUF2569 domain-containing protein [Neobacillus niacini]